MREIVLAAGGLSSAIASSMCCILPLGMGLVGMGSSWLGVVIVLAAYQPLFLSIAVVCIAARLWLVYRRRAGACETGACPDRLAGRIVSGALWVKGSLWLGAALIALATGAEFRFHLFS